MKKITAKDKTKKIKEVEDIDLPEVETEDLEGGVGHEGAELDPEVLKVLTKPKKNKNSIDSTDYIPELERGDIDEEFDSNSSGF